MKTKKILPLLLSVALLPGCVNNEQRVRLYAIDKDEVQTDNSSIETLSLEKTEERFVWKKVANETEWGLFDFIFCDYNDYYLKNSQEFTYLDSSNNTIRMTNHNPNEYYDFYGSITIYIYYNNSSETVKNAIANREFTIQIGGYEWKCN